MSNNNNNNTSIALVYSKLSQALGHDDKKKYKEAYQSYLECIDQIVKTLQTHPLPNLSSPNNSNATANAVLQNKKQTQALFKYAKDCLERVEYIYNQSTTTPSASLLQSPSGGGISHHLHAAAASSSSSMQFTNNNNSTTTTSPLSGSFVNQNYFNASSTTTTPRTPLMDTSNISPLTPSTSQQQQLQQHSPLSASSTYNPIHHTFGSNSASTTTGGGATQKLNQVRKYAENMALQRWREQNTLNKLMEEERKEKERREKSVKEFKQNFYNNKFRWRTEDKWSKFVDQSFNYEKMDQLLLEKDKIWLEKCRTLILLQLSHHSHAEYSVQQQQQQSTQHFPVNLFDDPEQEEIAQYVRQYLYIIFTNGNHALTKLLVLFIQNIFATYGQPITQLQQESAVDDQLKQMVRGCLTDVQTFIEKLLSVLIGKYWSLLSKNIVLNNNHNYNNMVSDYIIDLVEQTLAEQLNRFIMSTQIQWSSSTTTTTTPAAASSSSSDTSSGAGAKHSVNLYQLLQSNYYNQMSFNKKKNEALNQKLMEMNARTSLSLRHFNVEEKFLLRELPAPYQRSIQELTKLNYTYTLEEQLLVLSKTIDSIGQCVNDYYNSQSSSNGSSSSKVIVGTDDMLPIFIYVVVKAHVVNVFSKLNYLEDVANDDVLRGSGGYALATCQIAAEHLLSLTWQVMETDFQKNLSTSPLSSSSTTSSAEFAALSASLSSSSAAAASYSTPTPSYLYSPSNPLEQQPSPSPSSSSSPGAFFPSRQQTPPPPVSPSQQQGDDDDDIVGYLSRSLQSILSQDQQQQNNN